MRSTQKYGEITNQKVEKEMKKLAGRIKGKYTVNQFPVDT